MIKEAYIKLYVKVIPNARCTRIMGWITQDKGLKLLKISVAAIAEKGKANQAVLKFLSVQLKIPLKNITLEQGAKDQYKTILIKSDQTNVMQLLAPQEQKIANDGFHPPLIHQDY